jgi:predicted TIM-barrel fold metal-dependent hydrolase
VSTAVTDNDRYVVISTDSHAGGSHAMYRDYLEKEYLEEFDAWRAKYSNPFRDLQDDGRTRNWDGELRLADQRADGVVAEVTFPNTVPPFFPTGALLTPPPNADNFRRRLAGIRAHNRWMVDWVSQAPNERAGVAQIFLNDLDEAVKDIEFAAENGLKGGILLPAVPDDAKQIEPLYSPVYDKLWAACQANDVIVNQHSGGGSPSYGNYSAATFMFLAETTFYSKRGMTHLVLSGVFERFPGLKYVLAEQGCAWVPPVLEAWDTFHQEMRDTGRVGELGFPVEEVLPMAPSDYVKRNVWFAASFPGKGEIAAAREVLGTDRVMWASDYPHHEGTWPYTREALRWAFEGCPVEDTAKMLGGNAIDLYGFDDTALLALASEWGPTVEEVSVPIAGRPEGATSPAFAR